MIKRIKNKESRIKNFSGLSNKRSYFKNAGLSIIEFLIYIAILAMAIAALGLVSSNVFRVGVRNDVVQEVSHNGRFAMQRIGRAIHEASAILKPESKEKGSILELSFENPTKNPTIFDISEGKLRIKEGNGEYIELTTSRVVVDKIVFRGVSEDSVRVDSVGVEMNISFYNPQGLPEYEFKSFFTSSFTLEN